MSVVHGHHGTFAGAEHWAKRLDDPTRDAWQLPDEVLRALNLEPTMTVADVGAGTGYFAVRLARAIPNGKVIATDTEPDMVRYLEARAEREQLQNLRVALATTTSLGLPANGVDAIVIVHVWHHLDKRTAYARQLAAALRGHGRLFIVDFSPSAQTGPPQHMRTSPETVAAELAEAGFSVSASPIALPDQYIVEAQLP